MHLTSDEHMVSTLFSQIKSILRSVSRLNNTLQPIGKQVMLFKMTINKFIFSLKIDFD